MVKFEKGGFSMDIFTILFIVVLGVLYISSRISQLEKKMDLRMKRLEAFITKDKHDAFFQYEEEVKDELKQLVKDGENVKSVKKAREHFGFSLLEAKQYVDSLH
jgi:ribosomal protein L7/L12